jgi:NAD(P)-dependent dehydrogenase (short-subunit alcohol dehydrogenase family)
MGDLSNKTIIITGASRGIGRAMALRFARDGANIVIAAKSAKQHPKLKGTIFSVAQEVEDAGGAKPHPKLKGTIFTVAQEVEDAGGKALPFKLDVRLEDQVNAMVKATVEKFGGIDALVNNAGAISLTRVEKTPIKRYDLMQSVNTRAVFSCSQAGRFAISEIICKSTYFKFIAAIKSGYQMAERPCPLHPFKIRHDDAQPGHGKGIRTLWNCRQLFMAPNSYRNRGN